MNEFNKRYDQILKSIKMKKSNDYEEEFGNAKWCLRFANPYQCAVADRNNDKAVKYAKQEYKNDGIRNGHVDAFRHGIWNALMARYLRWKVAKLISTEYEFRFSIPPVHINHGPQMERDMDLYNNKIGYNMYLHKKSEQNLIDDLRGGFSIHKLGIIILGPYYAFGNTDY